MNKNVSAYMDTVCSRIRSKQSRLSARAELSGHIQSIVDELTRDGYTEDKASQAALERMGDPIAIGNQLAALNAPWQNALPVAAGVLLLLALIVYAIMAEVYLFNLSGFVLVVLLTLAFILIGGLSRLTRLSALTRGRTAALYAGGIGMIAGLIDMMTRLNDPAMLGPGISISITSVLYGLTVSAVLTSVAHLLRPLSGEEIRRILGWEDILLDR